MIKNKYKIGDKIRLRNSYNFQIPLGKNSNLLLSEGVIGTVIFVKDNGNVIVSFEINKGISVMIEIEEEQLDCFCKDNNLILHNGKNIFSFFKR